GVFYAGVADGSVNPMAISPETLAIINPENQAKINHPPIWENPKFGQPNEGGGGGGGRGANPLVNGLNNLPIIKPPYGAAVAIDLNSGDMKWRVAHGDTPDNIRTNPALKDLNIPKTGQPGNVAGVVTKNLFILGDPGVTAPPGRQRGAMLR